MATKTDFSVNQWRVLQWAVTDAMSYVSMADRGFWDTFKEANAAAKFIAAARTGNDNALVRDLAGDVKAGRDKEVVGNPADMAGEVVERLSEASTLLAEKAPDDLDAFKAFVIGISEATAEATHGVGDNEAKAIEKIKGALG